MTVQLNYITEKERYIKATYPLKDNIRQYEFDGPNYGYDGEWIYLIYNHDTGLCKIGITWEIKRRFQQLKRQSGANIELLMATQCGISCDESASYVENYLHKLFKPFRVSGEWFKLSKRHIAIIRTICYQVEGVDGRGKLWGTDL